MKSVKVLDEFKNYSSISLWRKRRITKKLFKRPMTFLTFYLSNDWFLTIPGNFK